MKIIKIKTCQACPYIRHNDGGGHCEPFIICDEFNIMLFDLDGKENFDYRNKIHPDCKLKEIT